MGGGKLDDEEDNNADHDDGDLDTFYMAPYRSQADFHFINYHGFFKFPLNCSSLLCRHYIHTSGRKGNILGIYCFNLYLNRFQILSFPVTLFTFFIFQTQLDLVSYAFSPVQFSYSVVSDSLRHCGPQHLILPCPSPTPGAGSNSCPSSW